MSKRLNIEPLRVVEQRHILRAVQACNGRIKYAAEVLGIGKETIYRKLRKYSGGNVTKLRTDITQNLVDVDWEAVEQHAVEPLQQRRRVERVIECCGGNLVQASAQLGVTRARLSYSLICWHKDNERNIRSIADREGITEDEIQVLLRQRTVREHADVCGCSISWAYKLLDEACALVGLRRYRNWLFLCAES